MTTILRFLPGGEVRGIYTDALPLRHLMPGMIPHRASRVEVIQEGKHRGRFHVDFSLLAEMTGKVEHRACLTETFDSYQEAVAAEVEWLRVNYVLA